jgi:hypothetical protein
MRRRKGNLVPMFVSDFPIQRKMLVWRSIHPIHRAFSLKEYEI